MPINKKHATPRPTSAVPPLLFGESQAKVHRRFHAWADQLGLGASSNDLHTQMSIDFYYKSSALAVNGLVFYHAVIGNLLARAHNHQCVLSTVISGETRVRAGHTEHVIRPYQALLAPPGETLTREVRPDQLATSLCIVFDLERLNRVSQVMQGGGHFKPVVADRLQGVRLRHAGLDLRRAWLLHMQQIDAWGADEQLLQHAGFDDQVYRQLAITLQPEVFLRPHLPRAERLAGDRPQISAAFAEYVDTYFKEPMGLTQVELALGVSARALQYACAKAFGCSPLSYLRNRRLDHARDLLMSEPETKIAQLAADLNFSSQSQFSKYFKQRFGLLPSQMHRG
jgi:AraC-like DNA-binding protein